MCLCMPVVFVSEYMLYLYMYFYGCMHICCTHVSCEHVVCTYVFIYMWHICTSYVPMSLVCMLCMYKLLSLCVCTHIWSFSELQPSVGLLWRHQKVHEPLWNTDVIIRDKEGPTYFRKHTLSEWHFVHHKSHAEDWHCTNVEISVNSSHKRN